MKGIFSFKSFDICYVNVYFLLNWELWVKIFHDFVYLFILLFNHFNLSFLYLNIPLYILFYYLLKHLNRLFHLFHILPLGFLQLHPQLLHILQIRFFHRFNFILRISILFIFFIGSIIVWLVMTDHTKWTERALACGATQFIPFLLMLGALWEGIVCQTHLF